MPTPMLNTPVGTERSIRSQGRNLRCQTTSSAVRPQAIASLRTRSRAARCRLDRRSHMPAAIGACGTGAGGEHDQCARISCVVSPTASARRRTGRVFRATPPACRRDEPRAEPPARRSTGCRRAAGAAARPASRAPRCGRRDRHAADVGRRLRRAITSSSRPRRAQRGVRVGDQAVAADLVARGTPTGRDHHVDARLCEHARASRLACRAGATTRTSQCVGSRRSGGSGVGTHRGQACGTRRQTPARAGANPPAVRLRRRRRSAARAASRSAAPDSPCGSASRGTPSPCAAVPGQRGLDRGRLVGTPSSSKPRGPGGSCSMRAVRLTQAQVRRARLDDDRRRAARAGEVEADLGRRASGHSPRRDCQVAHERAARCVQHVGAQGSTMVVDDRVRAQHAKRRHRAPASVTRPRTQHQDRGRRPAAHLDVERQVAAPGDDEVVRRIGARFRPAPAAAFEAPGCCRACRCSRSRSGSGTPGAERCSPMRRWTSIMPTRPRLGRRHHEERRGQRLRSARTGKIAPLNEALARDLLAALADRAGRPPICASRRLASAGECIEQRLEAHHRCLQVAQQAGVGEALWRAGAGCAGRPVTARCAGKSWLLCVRTACNEPAGETLCRGRALGQAHGPRRVAREAVHERRQAAAQLAATRRSSVSAQPADRSSRWRCRSCAGSGRGCRAPWSRCRRLGRAQV